MAHIQSIPSATSGSGNVNQVFTLTATTAIAAGHGVCVFGYMTVTAGTPSTSNITISDNASGNTYHTVAVLQGTVSTTVWGYIGYGINILGSPTQIIITASGGVTLANGGGVSGADEFSTELTSGIGLNGSALVTVIPTSTGQVITSGTVNSSPGRLVFGAGILNNTGESLTAGSGFTAGLTDTGNQIWGEYQSASGTTAAGTWTVGGTIDSGQWFVGVMTFQSLGPGPDAFSNHIFRVAQPPWR